MIAAILRQHGYRVTTAADGAEATACFARLASEIHLVVLDYHMPNLSGAVLAKVLQHINAEVRILMVSGLTRTGEPGRAAKPDDYAGSFLLKPFKPETLLRRVQELLMSRQTAVFPP